MQVWSLEYWGLTTLLASEEKVRWLDQGMGEKDQFGFGCFHLRKTAKIQQEIPEGQQEIKQWAGKGRMSGFLRRSFSSWR